MFSKIKNGLFGLGLGAGLLLAGCQSGASQPQASAASSAPGQAVTCDKCQVTWINYPSDVGQGRIVAYSSKPEMICSACKDEAAKCFATGKAEGTCSACGGKMNVCAPQ